MQKILDEKKEYVPGFDGLRFWWILMIVLSHFFNVFSNTYPTIGFLLNGHFAAEGFFVLSGFLQFRHNRDCLANSNPIKAGISSYYKGLKRFAVLNVMTMIPFISVTALNGVINWKYGIIIVMNCLLVQNWVPFKDYSINGISWFLSSIMFIYLIMPFMFKMYCFIRRKIGKSQTASVFVVLICFLIASEHWFSVSLYKEPFFNLLAFMLGAPVSELFDGRITDDSRAFSLVGILLLVLGYVYTPSAFPYLWDCVVCAVVVYFIKNTTCRLFVGEPIRKTGRISLEIMLIHYPVCCLLYPWLSEHCSGSRGTSLLFLTALVIFSFFLAYAFSLVRGSFYGNKSQRGVG